MLDLQKDRSFLRNLVHAGCELYVMDWGHPTLADQFDDFGELINGYMDEFVGIICDRHAISKVSLLGICQGACSHCAMPALHPDKVNNLVTAVTPVDFHADKLEERLDAGFMNVWTRGPTSNDIDLLIEAMGNIPGEAGGTMLSLMTPLRTLGKYNMTLVQASQQADALMNFLRMEKWLSDRPDHTGAAAQQWLKELYQQNKLARGQLIIDGRLVDLRAVTMPVLIICSETDTVIHPLASKAMRERIASDAYTELPVSGGHIGIFVARSKKLSNSIAEWLGKH